MRYFTQFSYNGTKYHGWQFQPNAITVQEVLENNLSLLLKEDCKLTGAGRTDTGVHAKIMYAHFDSSSSFDVEKIRNKLNAILPEDIAISKILTVHDEAHARFDATSRSYEYHIHTQKNVFNNYQSWYYGRTLDINAMNKAASMLLNHTNFKCFSKSNTDVNTYNCEITYAKWTKDNDNLIFTITADRFLRNMVRAIVGTLVSIGIGKLKPEAIEAIIASQDRGQAGFSVPAEGLYLTEIKYPYINSDYLYESL